MDRLLPSLLMALPHREKHTPCRVRRPSQELSLDPSRFVYCDNVIYPLALIVVHQALFHKQSGLQRYRAQLTMSYMEIYKDEVYDLLVNRDDASFLFTTENKSSQSTLFRHPNSLFARITQVRFLSPISQHCLSSR